MWLCLFIQPVPTILLPQWKQAVSESSNVYKLLVLENLEILEEKNAGGKNTTQNPNPKPNEKSIKLTWASHFVLPEHKTLLMLSSSSFNTLTPDHGYSKLQEKRDNSCKMDQPFLVQPYFLQRGNTTQGRLGCLSSGKDMDNLMHNSSIPSYL